MQLTPEPDTPPVLLSRQPILDHDGRVRGYELLFRAPAGTAEHATATMLGQGESELLALTGGLPAWIKVSREFLLTFDPLPVAAGTVVLLLDAERTVVDDALLARLRRLRAEGHTLALDRFLPRPDREPLLAFASYLRIDLAQTGVVGLRTVLERLPFERPTIVATNVELPSQRDACVRRGVELLQGWFFERPRTVSGRVVPVGAVDRLRAVVALRDTPEFEEVERIVADDPGLTVRLLRFANSAAVSAGRELGSVREAMVLLGSERVRQFLLLILLGELGQGRPALVAAAILRGRLCHAIAHDFKLGDADHAFTAGVLSVTDALLDQPMHEVVESLPLTPTLKWALLGRDGPIGSVLDLAIRIERDRVDGTRLPFGKLDEVVQWADDALRALPSATA